MPTVMTSCAACGAPAPDLARFCPACGAAVQARGRPSAARGLTTRWQANVADAPLGHLLTAGHFAVCLGQGGMLHAFHGASPTPRLARRLADGGFTTPAILQDGVLVAASQKAVVAVDLVPALSGRAVAVPRDRRHPLPGPPVSALAVHGPHVAVACRAGGRTEIHLFESEPRKGLEPRKVLTVSDGERWHLWLTGDAVLAGQPGGALKCWALASGAPLPDLPLPGGLGPLRLHQSDRPLAQAADGSLLLLQQPQRLLYRPDRGTVWAWTLLGPELYACVDRACVRVASDAAASASVDLPGQGFSVVPPVLVQEGALVLTQDGHLSLAAPEAGALRLRWSERLFEPSAPVTVGLACTADTVFAWVPGTGLRALEPVA